MDDSKRIIVNTLAQHVRTIINICLSLYSTRLVLEALGQSDYGVFMLVAGIVSLLSYFTNAMVTTTQRHLSYAQGRSGQAEAKRVFDNGYMLNIVIGLVVAFIFCSFTSLLFNGHTLKIDASKLTEAKYVYLLVISSVFFTFITSPFRALFISKENIVYISIIDVLDGVLKLGLVFLLFYFKEYRLVFYSGIISSVMLFNLLALALYGKRKYSECSLIPNPKQWSNTIQKKIIGFTTWTIYGSVCIFFRSQGIAVVLNRIYGTIINASFGIANQVFGSIEFLTQAILNAFSPQIMKAEGAGDRQKMLYLSENASRYGFMLMSIIVIPILFEMPDIIKIWLGKIPDNSVLFCRVFFISSLTNQLTMGLSLANQATGKIRNFTLITFTLKLMTVPFLWIALRLKYDIMQAMMIYVFFELLASLVRLPYMRKTVHLSIRSYIKHVVFPVIIPCVSSILVCYFISKNIHFEFRFVFTGILSAFCFVVTSWIFALTTDERSYVLNSIKRINNKAGW